MLETTVRVTNRLGLHARAAAKLVRLAKGVQSSISVTSTENGRSANAVSILDLLAIAATCGTLLDIAVNGVDEAEAIQAVEELFEARFDEE
jgi:phosphocarrier protein HPr